MTAPSISNQQLPPPPYSKTDNLPTSNYQPSLNGSVQGQDQQVQAQGQAPELVSAAETLTLLTRNATPPSDADTVAMDDAQSPVILPQYTHNTKDIQLYLLFPWLLDTQL